MAINLETIKKGKEPTPPKIWIYGVDGIGKSSFAAKASKCIIIPTEKRLGHIDCAKFPTCKTWQDILDCIAALVNEDHDYDYMALDSLDWAERLAHQHLCDKYNETSIKSNEKQSPFSFGRGAVLAEDLISELKDALDYLQEIKNMGIILTAHASVTKFNNPMGADYDIFLPNLQERVREMFQQWSDCILFANYHILTKEEDAGFNKKKSKGLGNGERVMYTQERPSFKAKNSYGLPEVMPLDFKAFEEAHNNFLNS